MAKKLKFEYNGKKYTLEFTRATVAQMEMEGFKASNITNYPLSTIPSLFKGAFLAHHSDADEGTIDKIYDHISGKADLIALLAEMYADPVQSLMGEPDEGKVMWEKNW